MRSLVAVSLLFVYVHISLTASAQLSKSGLPQQPNPSAATDIPQDPLGRTTPRGTVMGFLAAASAQKYEVAAQYLDTRSDGKTAAILARQLFVVLDRRLPAKLNTMSNDPWGSLSNPADSRRELIGSVVTEAGRVDIYVERIDRPNGVPIWLFSRDTLVDIPEVYNEIDAASAETRLPDFMLRRYFGITLFAWAFFFVFLPLLYFALSLVNRLVGMGVGRAMRRWTSRKSAGDPTILPHPVRFLILAGTVFQTLHQISLPLLTRQAGSIVMDLLLIAALVWTLFLVNGNCELYLKKRMESRGRISATGILRPARRVGDLIAAIIGLILLLHTLGINPTATIAGLGVGGIAIALAAQKTLENVIGGASLIMDGAVRVGDVFKIGELTGTIEVIGLRSTRVRTSDRTVVTIPNGQMAMMTLENFSARDQFLFRHLIGLEYRTPPAALDLILVQVRTLLKQEARISPGSVRVRFLRFAEFSLELEVFAYIAARDWNDFLEIQEELLIQIRQASASAGVAFALPSRAIYVTDDARIGATPAQPVLQGMVVDKEAGHEAYRR